MSNAPALLLILVASDRLACVRVPITSFEDPTTAPVIRAEMMERVFETRHLRVHRHLPVLDRLRDPAAAVGAIGRRDLAAEQKRSPAAVSQILDQLCAHPHRTPLELTGRPPGPPPTDQLGLEEAVWRLGQRGVVGVSPGTDRSDRAYLGNKLFRLLAVIFRYVSGCRSRLSRHDALDRALHAFSPVA